MHSNEGLELKEPQDGIYYKDRAALPLEAPAADRDLDEDDLFGSDVDDLDESDLIGSDVDDAEFSGDVDNGELCGGADTDPYEVFHSVGTSRAQNQKERQPQLPAFVTEVISSESDGDDVREVS